MRVLYTENLSCGRSKQALNRTPVVRRHKLNKGRFFITLALFAVLVALGIVGIQSFTFKDDLKSNPSAVSEDNSAAKPANNNGLLAGKVIVVDAGHGGFDPGAIGISGEHESDLNLKMASILQTSLEAAGARVIMTRTDKNAIAPTKDEDMAKRREISQENNPDFFISVHMNMETDPSIKGPILMFQQGSVPGENLAKAITNGINSNIKTLAPCKYRSADLIVLRGNMEPSVLVECGFISNQEEKQKLLNDSYQKEFAQAVVYGIESFIA